MTPEPLLQVAEQADPADLDVVDAGLGRHNDAVRALQDVRPLAVLARDTDGRVIGGAVGRTWGACCELQQLWVDESLRRQGLGRALLARFEDAARARSCTLAYLETFSFQAPAFYAAAGWHVAFETAGFTGDVRKWLMQKAL